MVLRDVVESDVDVFCAHQADAGAAELAGVPSRSREDYLAHWQRLLADQTVVKQTVLSNGVVAGNVVSFERNGVRELGYWLGRGHWGRGVASAAVPLFLLVEQRRPLHAVVSIPNVASRRVLEKSGFSLVEEREGAYRFVLR